jgi:hypothetical protein
MSLSSTQQAPASNILPLADIHLPQAPSWGKQLAQLTPRQTSDIAQLLKQAALSHFPRERIASLHGLAWWHFVEQQLPVKKQANVHFSSRSDMLELALYGQQPLSETNQQRFYDDVRYWLSHALPVKKVIATTSTKGHQHA